MNLDVYIERLLQTEDCFSVKGLGGFVTRRAGAEIHPVTHKFKPPAKKIVFNPQLDTNSEKLVSLIVEKEKIAVAQAHEYIENYVTLIHQKLQGYGYYEIHGVGRFYYTPVREIEFDPFVSNDFLEESFGLPEILYKPVEREIMRHRPAKKKMENSDNPNDKPVKNSSKVVWALLPLLVILGAGAVMYGVKDQNEAIARFFAFSSAEPSSLVKGEEEPTEGKNDELVSEENFAENAMVDTTEEEFTVEMETGENFEGGKNLVTESDPVPIYDQPAISTRSSVDVEERVESRSGVSGAYSIVVGAFAKKGNADKLRNQLDCAQCDIYVLEPKSGTGLYKVVVADFADKKEAYSRLPEYRNQFGESAWVMTNN